MLRWGDTGTNVVPDLPEKIKPVRLCGPICESGAGDTDDLVCVKFNFKREFVAWATGQCKRLKCTPAALALQEFMLAFILVISGVHLSW